MLGTFNVLGISLKNAKLIAVDQGWPTYVCVHTYLCTSLYIYMLYNKTSSQQLYFCIYYASILPDSCPLPSFVLLL